MWRRYLGPASSGWRVAVAMMLWGALLAPAALGVNWDGGGATSEWTDRFNWQFDALPATSDSAVIVGDAATITGVVVPTVTSVSLGAATLSGGLTITATSNRAGLTALSSVNVAPAGNLALRSTGTARSQLTAANLVTGGTLSIANRSDLVLSGSLMQTGGTVSLANGGTLSTPLVSAQAGLLEATGTIDADVRIGDGAGGAATLSPGGGIGSLAIDGNLTLNSDARLRMHLSASPGAVRWDSISVNGTLQLGGVLELSNLGTVAPTPGTPYGLLTANGLVANSRFSEIIGLELGNGSLVPTFDLTGKLNVFYTVMRGDMNGDQAVNELDVEKFAWAIRDGSTYHQHFVLAGGAAFVNMADLNLDGERTWADIPLFLDAVKLDGGSVEAAASAMFAILAAVPEPSSALHCALATAYLACTRRRVRSNPSPPK